MAWRWEDGGPRRTALAPGGPGTTPAPGSGRDFYVCSFLALTRVEVVSP